jgi:lipopolysaccharide biosynthesis glycosyltransferase
MSATLRVVMASDHRYFIGLLVSATSVAWWLPVATTLELHVLDDGILESQFRTLTRRLRTIQPSSRIVRHPVQELDLQRYSASHTYPATALARLFIPTLIPTNDPILYLDVDTVCLGDLSHLATLPMGDNVMAACTEVVGQSRLADDCPFELSSMADRQAPYFNTGVILLNPAAWKEQQISEQALAQLARSDIQFRYADQTVLNYIARHQIKRLHDHHNTLNSLFASDQEIWPKILHFYGGTKPWHCFEPQSDAWLAWYIISRRIGAVKIHQHSSLLWRPLLANRLCYPSRQRHPAVGRITEAIALKRLASGNPPPPQHR